MKNLLITLAAALATNAYAALPDTTSACAAIADLATTTVKIAKNGMDYSEFEALHMKAAGTTQGSMTAGEKVMLAIQQEAFMSWTGMDTMTVRKLAFTTCTVKLQRAYR